MVPLWYLSCDLGFRNGTHGARSPSRTPRTGGDDWTVDVAPGIVLADLPRTIQFPSGTPLPTWMTDAKTALRVALGDFEIAPTQVLEATLAGHLDPGTDLENVLLYNVGVPATALARGLRLRREAEPASGRVVQRYRAVPARPSTIDNAQAFATISATIDRAETSSARRLWAALRRRATIDYASNAAPDLVAMRLTLGGDWRLSVDVIKRALDASCAAFHVHDGTALDVVSDLLAAELGTTAEAVRTLALDPRGAALGPAPFLAPWGRTVRVHPQDDRIAAVDVDVEPSPRSRLLLSAALVAPLRRG